jgi:hypothetical protein
MKHFGDLLLYLICGIPVVFAADEDDPELWDNPKKKERIRRRMARQERRKSGKKTDV